MPTFLSCFSGIGGFDLGLERAGWTCVGQIEHDPFCQRVLQRHWPDIQRWGDIQTVRADDLRLASRRWQRQELEGQIPLMDSWQARNSPNASTEQDVGRLDLLCGGWPCQGNSVAGQRYGLADDRSSLFWEIIRLAKAFTPTWGFFENVPGLLSVHAGRDFWAVLTALRECWPTVGYRTLDSRFFGVAQRRRRLFFICGPGDDAVSQVLFEPESRRRDSQESTETRADLAYCLNASVRKSGDGHGNAWNSTYVTKALAMGSNATRYDYESEEFIIANTVRASDGHHGHSSPRGDGCDNLVVSRDAVPKTAGGLVTDLRAGNPHISTVLAYTLTANYGKQPDISDTNHGPPNLIIRGHQTGANGIGVQSGTADRLQAPGEADAMQSGKTVRRLTPLECERLQAFPDGHTCLCGCDPYSTASCQCPDGSRYRALGNAVTVNVITWIGQRLKYVHESMEAAR